MCDYEVQDAEHVHGKPLTKQFLYQTVCVWVGIVLAAFPRVIWLGVGEE